MPTKNYEVKAEGTHVASGPGEAIVTSNADLFWWKNDQPSPPEAYRMRHTMESGVDENVSLADGDHLILWPQHGFGQAVVAVTADNPADGETNSGGGTSPAAPTTNIAGADAPVLDEAAETVTITGATDPSYNGVYSYDPASLVAGLPQFLRVNSVEENPAGTFDVLLDGIYLAPADDLPDLITEVHANSAAINGATIPFALSATYAGQLVEIVLKLVNDQTIADSIDVTGRVQIQAADPFLGTRLVSQGGYLTRPADTGQTPHDRLVVAAWLKKTPATGQEYFIAMGDTQLRFDNDQFALIRFGVVNDALVTAQTGILRSTATFADGDNILLVASGGRGEQSQIAASVVDSLGVQTSIVDTGGTSADVEADERIVYDGELVLGAAIGPTYNLRNDEDLYQIGVWAPSAIPDFSDPAVIASLQDAQGLPTALSVINALFGVAPLDLFRGPAAEQATNKGSLANFTITDTAYVDGT